MARALVLTPQVLLLDEPFSQLDAVTTVFVTHDQAEAVEVADSITLLLDGKLAGNGPPEAFYTAPPSLAAARFFGVTNELAGRVSAGTFRGVECCLRVAAALPDGPAVLVVRPEAVQLAASPGRGVLTAVVVSARFAGTLLTLDVQLQTGAAGAGVMLTVHTPLGWAPASTSAGRRIFTSTGSMHCLFDGPMRRVAGAAAASGEPVTRVSAMTISGQTTPICRRCGRRRPGMRRSHNTVGRCARCPV